VSLKHWCYVWRSNLFILSYNINLNRYAHFPENWGLLQFLFNIWYCGSFGYGMEWSFDFTVVKLTLCPKKIYVLHSNLSSCIVWKKECEFKFYLCPVLAVCLGVGHFSNLYFLHLRYRHNSCITYLKEFFW
jgi:hypothetical protein